MNLPPVHLRPIHLRPAQDADQAFLYQVYAEARAAEMALLTDWSEAQRDGFLRFQFTAQDRHYREQYPGASHDLILLGEKPVGRLMVWRPATELRLVDIALLASARGQGIGTAVLSELLREADAMARPMGLHVAPGNPARRLYARLGFQVVGMAGIYQFMRRATRLS